MTDPDGEEDKVLDIDPDESLSFLKLIQLVSKLYEKMYCLRKSEQVLAKISSWQIFIDSLTC